MWERGGFLATILEQLRRPCRPRHPYAVPRTSLQCVCTRRRNCIAQLSPCREYALRTIDFPARSSATIELTHYPARQRPASDATTQFRFGSFSDVDALDRDVRFCSMNVCRQLDRSRPKVPRAEVN